MESAGKWHFDLQTLILLGGIAASLGAWGWTLNEIRADTERNTAALAGIAAALEKNDSRTALNEVRIVALEKIAADAITLRRELDGVVGQFRSDLAVIKEILERLEKDKTNGPR